MSILCEHAGRCQMAAPPVIDRDRGRLRARRRGPPAVHGHASLVSAPRSKLKVRDARVVVEAWSWRVRRIHRALIESSRSIIPRSVSVVPVEPSCGMVPDVPRLSRISTRCHCSRAKRNSGARSKDQNSIHHLAPFVVPPALLVTEITARARTGFRWVPVTNGGTGTRPTTVISLGTSSEGERQAGNDLGLKFPSVGLTIRADAEGLAILPNCQMNLLPSPATTYSRVRPCLPILPGARACAKAPASMPGLSSRRFLAIPGTTFRPGRASAAHATIGTAEFHS